MDQDAPPRRLLRGWGVGGGGGSRGVGGWCGPPHPPPPPPNGSVGPNFSHHKARVQAVGWFPLGTRPQGSRGADHLLPLPPPTEMGPDRKQAQHTHTPSMPSHPHCRPSHGERGLSGSGRRTTSMLGSGTRMVTQQVVLISHTNEQVDPSTTLPPPSLRPRREGCTESAPSGPKKWRL